MAVAHERRVTSGDVEIILHPIPSPDSKPYIIVVGADRHMWFC
jgi:virginiamycin B lyase